jgi:ferrous iron transport protein A
MTLSELPRGSAAKVLSVRGDRVVTTRLMELGLLPGTKVRMVRAAPFGDPLVVEVRGAELSLRASEADLIGVEPPRSAGA